MVVRWLDEPRVQWLGVPPSACLQNPQFVSCYAAQAAQAISECAQYPAEVRGECTLYFNDFLAFTHCRTLCPEMPAPIKPASMSSQFPPGSGGGGQSRTTPSSSTSTESKTSPGLVIAAIAIIGVVAYAALS